MLATQPGNTSVIDHENYVRSGFSIVYILPIVCIAICLKDVRCVRSGEADAILFSSLEVADHLLESSIVRLGVAVIETSKTANCLSNDRTCSQLSKSNTAKELLIGKVKFLSSGCVMIHVNLKLEIRVGWYLDRVKISETVLLERAINLQGLIKEERLHVAVTSDMEFNVCVRLILSNFEDIVHFVKNCRNGLFVCGCYKTIVDEDGKKNDGICCGDLNAGVCISLSEVVLKQKFVEASV